MTTLASDLRFGFRTLRKSPGLTLVAVLTIALGVGLTTLAWSFLDGTVLRGVPVPAQERLVNVYQSIEVRGIDVSEVPFHDYLDLRDRQTVFEDLAAFYQGTLNLAGDEGPPERYQGAFVSANALAMLGVPTLLGRVFRDGEDAGDAPPRIVLSWHVWRNRFGSDPAVVGRTVRVNGETAEIIGVMPEGFRFPFREDAWVTYRWDPATMARRSGFVGVFGRLREGVPVEAARSSLDGIARELEAIYPEDNEGARFRMQPYAERFMPRQIAAVMFLMLASTFGVLLIACANVANLLLARASVRAREVAVRTALGARRSRVIRQLLSEAFVLALAGGVLGTALAWVGVDAMNVAIADIVRPYWIAIRLDASALGFGLLVTLTAAVAAGTVPAVRASGVAVGELLKDEARGSSSFRMGRFSASLVVGEIAVSCGLLVAAGLMIKSVVNLRTLDLGFEPAGVLTGRVGLFAADYPTRADRTRFFRTLEERLAAEPGVRAVSLASSLPALGAEMWTISIEGESYPSARDHPVANGAVVSTGFFDVVGVPLLRGRDFAPSEVWDAPDAVAIVNESFARSFLPGRDALGARVRIEGDGSTFPWMRVIGVVPDLHVGGNVGGIGDDLRHSEQMYVTPSTLDVHFLTAALRTQGPPEALATRLREVVLELDPNLPVFALAPMPDAIEQSTWAFGLFGSLFTIFGVAALFMAAVGLYGVMAFSVAQRRQEVGVRMALGAGPGEIRGMILRRGSVQLGIGMALGLLLGFLIAKPLSVVTFGVSLTDPTVYAAIVVTLGAAGLLACLAPARAAMRTDPAEAMRSS